MNSFNKYTPFLVLEGKRLPTPGTGREREYVTGRESRSGGIQRFRLGLHGHHLSTVAMIGYVQSESTVEWHERVNRWIDDESTSSSDTTCSWSQSDFLGLLTRSVDSRVSRCSSKHHRASGSTGQIAIQHLWVEM